MQIGFGNTAPIFEHWSFWPLRSCFDLGWYAAFGFVTINKPVRASARCLPRQKRLLFRMAVARVQMLLKLELTSWTTGFVKRQASSKFYADGWLDSSLTRSLLLYSWTRSLQRESQEVAKKWAQKQFLWMWISSSVRALFIHFLSSVYRVNKTLPLPLFSILQL